MPRLNRVLLLLLLVFPRHPVRADSPPPVPSPPPPVLLEDARLPAGTVVEPLGEAGLVRLGVERPARRYLVTGPLQTEQTSCNYVSGTFEKKRARWEVAVFDDPGGVDLARLAGLLMDLRERRRADLRAHYPGPRNAIYWGTEGPPDARPPLFLCGGPRNHGLSVVWAAGHLWEWNFLGFMEGGGAFGNGGIPEFARYGEGQGEPATPRQWFTASEKEFRPLFVTTP